jgi:hypothetical protein
MTSQYRGRAGPETGQVKKNVPGRAGQESEAAAAGGRGDDGSDGESDEAAAEAEAEARRLRERVGELEREKAAWERELAAAK